MQNLSTGTSASIDERCPMTYKVEGSDFVAFTIGDDDQHVELLLNAEGARKLAMVSGQAVADMDALYQQEEVEREAASARPCVVGNGVGA